MSQPLTRAKTTAGWLVIWTESRAEKKVASRLAAQGFDQWLPTVVERRKWSDRWRDVVIPLFPGYLFARGDASEVHRVLRTPGVMTVVKDGGRAATLSDSFIASLRSVLESNTVAAEPVAEPMDYEPGDEVVIREGPLAGLRGVIQEVRNGRRLVVWIREIGRGVAFTVGAGALAHR